ncbi:TetR/AcrR family transcriptional regulator [Rhodococcus sp. BP-149]|nr:TetR/AcrR family transcriptional regulator [Rhodococcus sp. BP-288]MBY6695283.1 TetR/AcrR family transcriptional regulator [Rhodococcus sp. BP-188]MBY6700065.1 TetR/AcrR family transcriptional regulator [Rhodococcus sp. BP-285]MBY6704912.1 TetR/AcrR family transcriptional regulator [Rhodococcus sp. BP-283]MBY6713190.1 TetR/AcrR family transcriptional regulator [Rhodococcus sp. BP-160]MBY6715680.1 TetR/AcrR family transcriptional regulator [Rhodococcus sp. BP-110]MBY6721718.1 TetR/AcrR fami
MHLGEWVTARRIADEARIHRTGIYRYFADRADLDVAIQRTICGQLEQTLTASVTFESLPRSVVQRVVDAYVRWVVAHPTWAYVVEQNVTGSSESLCRARSPVSPRRSRWQSAASWRWSARTWVTTTCVWSRRGCPVSSPVVSGR